MCNYEVRCRRIVRILLRSELSSWPSRFWRVIVSTVRRYQPSRRDVCSSPLAFEDLMIVSNWGCLI